MRPMPMARRSSPRRRVGWGRMSCRQARTFLRSDIDALSDLRLGALEEHVMECRCCRMSCRQAISLHRKGITASHTMLVDAHLSNCQRCTKQISLAVHQTERTCQNIYLYCLSGSPFTNVRHLIGGKRRKSSGRKKRQHLNLN